ncbi:flagellar biosynthesis repressor FlbT [Methylobacterium sp. 4-46]|uniref:flagellar biosynthesis repressor FlbT n=1 Tax=unclassified Methylobacterium TaxID=2615210 RepID=UPI000165CD57|nr:MULTISPECIES: flagellar biosynthesis repressor FlbT [Methylobacterium]ACA19464.1 flagellar biosynthesis repressor FlbT [Methylobacterium sp. 4-46]WFT78663.1 flagellar biosynthesis repressor FlbT [Methylobacterium nodulans]
MARPGLTNPTRAFIKKGARFFLNGALMRASDSVTLDIHAVDVLLMPSHLIEADEVRTPLQRLYYLVQQMLIEPGRMAEWQEAYRALLVAGVGLPEHETLRPILRLVEREKYQSAMALLRKTMRGEEAQRAATEATSRRV